LEGRSPRQVDRAIGLEAVSVRRRALAGLPRSALALLLAAMRWLRARLRALSAAGLLAGKERPSAESPADDPWATEEEHPRHRFNPWE